MLPTFVIGLREGLEAALIVGIIAAFLRQQGRKDLLRWVFVGVGVAVVICVGIGVGLKIVSEDLPQKQQEGMETVIGVLAVGMVTYMVVWMKRHSRDLKGQLEGLAADAIGAGARGGRAMIAMAFLAVLREGIETVVFLLATFNESKAGAAGPVGVILGLALAVVLGYGIYRGGIRLNLSKFFRATGLVLVLVAAGLVVTALHTAHEAGWLNAGQGSTIDLSWLVGSGSVQSALLTGMLGVQAKPVVIEVIGWLVYLVPVGLFVAWPAGKGLARRATSRVLLAFGAACAVAAVVLFAVMPSRPGTPPMPTAVAGASVTTAHGKVSVAVGGTQVALIHSDSIARGGTTLDVYTAHDSVAQPRTTTAGYERIAQLNGGRLPIGVRAAASGLGTLRYTDITDYAAYLEPRTGRVVEVLVAKKTTATLLDSGREMPLSEPVASTSSATPATAVRAAERAASHDVSALDERSNLAGFGWFAAVLAALCLVGGAVLRLGTAQPQQVGQRHTAPQGSLIKS